MTARLPLGFCSLGTPVEARQRRVDDRKGSFAAVLFRQEFGQPQDRYATSFAGEETGAASNIWTGSFLMLEPLQSHETIQVAKGASKYLHAETAPDLMLLCGAACGPGLPGHPGVASQGGSPGASAVASGTGEKKGPAALQRARVRFALRKATLGGRCEWQCASTGRETQLRAISLATLESLRVARA